MVPVMELSAYLNTPLSGSDIASGVQGYWELHLKGLNPPPTTDPDDESTDLIRDISTGHRLTGALVSSRAYPGAVSELRTGASDVGTRD